jgi:hypothetical protein
MIRSLFATMTVLFASQLACGESAVRQPSRDEDVAFPAVARRPRELPAPAPSGTQAPPDAQPAVLMHAESLARFFDVLKRLEEREATDDVHIVQYGDSHTAADYTTAVVRKALQARFGDGGRGFVAVGTPHKGYRQDSVKPTGTAHFETERGKHAHGFVGDGRYGLAGVSMAAFKPSAHAASEYHTRTSRFELAYLEKPQGGSFDTYVDGNRVATVKTSASAARSGFTPISVPEGLHSLEIRARGDGDVRVFGAFLDRAQVGVVFDSLGILGARITTMREWEEEHFQEQLRHRNPDLVAFAYGTNESTDDASLDVYARAWAEALGRVRRAVPQAACLVIAPPDRAVQGTAGWETPVRIKELVALESQVAAAAGCAFYDTFTAMGGEGTIAKWAEEDPPRAAKDRVHFTKDSYEALGQLEATELLGAYDSWRKTANSDAGSRARVP